MPGGNTPLSAGQLPLAPRYIAVVAAFSFDMPPESSLRGLVTTFTNLLYFKYTLGLILDSTGFAKPKVHAEGRLAS